MAILKNVLIGLDQTVNCLIRLSDGFGTPDESLSARAYRLRKAHPALVKWIDRVFLWESHHCQASYGSEMARSQLPPEYNLILIKE